MTCMGVDWSGAESVPDWRVAYEQGNVRFVFLRALRSNGLADDQFPTQKAALKEIGLTWGAYGFFNDELDAQMQANKFISIVGPDCKLAVLDIERLFGDGQDIVAQAHTWLYTVGNTLGVTPIIYTGPSFWNEHMDDSFGEYHLWIAHYGVNEPTIPKGFSAAAFWQYASGEQMPGCIECGTVQPRGFSSPVDANTYLPGDHDDLVRRFNL